MRLRRLVPTVVVDVDDTLVQCHVLYEAVRFTVARELEPDNPGRAETFLGSTDKLFRSLTNMPVVEGSFGRLVGGAYVAYRLMRGDDVSQEDLLRVQRAANLVYQMPYKVVPGALQSLCQLRLAGYRLVAYTKGPEHLQRRKLVEANLLDRVDEVVYTAVPKTAASFKKLLSDVRADLADSFSVGDNYEEDIRPAVSAGIEGVQVGLTATDGHIITIVDAAKYITELGKRHLRGK